MNKTFWQTKSLSEMDDAEWEALCDGCGRCCLLKLEDADSGEIAFTAVSCQLLDVDSCRCTDYPKRKQLVPDCLQLNRDNVASTEWLPQTCAYRLVNEGKPLFDWHPLVSGNGDSVHEAGISVRGKIISETQVHPDSVEEFVIHWVN